MDITNKKISCEEANQLDLVDYLATLGYQPAQSPRGNNYWYLSMLPGRVEGTASFKVNRNKNIWYDFGKKEGVKGGTLVDFGIQYHNCSVSAFLELLSGPGTASQNVQRKQTPPDKLPEEKIIIVGDKNIESTRLISYLHRRRIPLDVAQKYCREVEFKFKDRSYYALGFKSDLGGYELRNEYFKGGNTPKSPTFIDNGAEDVTSFEGFFNLLSFETIHRDQNIPPTNYLVLNSLSFLERAFPILDQHHNKHLYWDRGKSGTAATQIALKHGSNYIDHSDLYKGYDDLNEWHCKIGSPPGQRLPSPAHKKLHR